MNSSLKQKYSEHDIASISKKILEARVTRSGLETYPGRLPESLSDAYRIQDLSMLNWPDKVVGWKVGGIPPQLQTRYGERWLSGPIYASNVKYCGDNKEVVEMPVFKEGFAAIEAELILELGDISVLSDSDELTAKNIESIIAEVYIGAEIASSPIQKINDLGPAGPISDFGNNSGMIVGPKLKNWRDNGLFNTLVSVVIDGVTHGPCNAKTDLDGPLGATKFLIQQLKKRGHEVPAGTLVSSGAITGVHDASVGAKSTIFFKDQGEIELTLTCNKG